MKKQKTVIVGVIFLLLTSILAMSDDGTNEPIVENKEITSEVSQVINPNKTEEVKSNKTVKDHSGIDTDMTKEELVTFKTQYIKKAEELRKQAYPFISPESYFEHKVNLNKLDELMDFGFFLTKKNQVFEENYTDKIVEANVIVLGTIDQLEYLYESDEEEWKSRRTGKLSRYYVKVHKMLKGAEYYSFLPKQVSYGSPMGKHVTATSDNKLLIGKKYILFFRNYPNLSKDLLKIRATSLKLEGSDLYLESSKSKLNLDYTELLHKINKFQEVNDTGNFYNRHYLREEK